MKNIRIFLLLLLAMPALAQAPEKSSKRDRHSKGERVEQKIREIMNAQQAAWNRGDLEGFMSSYWRSDSLRFIGSRGLTLGWLQTLNNYKKAYPDRETMGKLTFTILSVEKLSMRYAFAVGKYHLARKSGDLSGHFSLLWRKIKGDWVIVADHSD